MRKNAIKKFDTMDLLIKPREKNNSLYGRKIAQLGERHRTVEVAGSTPALFFFYAKIAFPLMENKNFLYIKEE